MLTRIVALVGLLLLASVPVAFGQTLADSLAVPATPETGPTLLDQIAATLASLIPILTLLVGTGLVTKYVPFMAKFSNMLIPFLNTLIAFFTVFAGPAPAHAGVFGDFVHSLPILAKAAGSFFLAGLAANTYEIFLRHPLEKAGWKKAVPKTG